MSRKQQCNSLVRSSVVILASAVIAIFAFVLREGEARGQGRFGERDQLAITGENLFAFSSERRAESQPTGDNVDVTNRFGILFSDRLDSGGSPHDPQVGGHYFVIPSLSIGGTIGYESRGGSFTPAPAGNMIRPTQPKDDVATFIFMPKVGYVLMLNDVLGFWFRGGPSFVRVGSSDGTDSRIKESVSFWLLSVDALFVVSPVQHFAFYVGPQGDISFAGSRSQTNVMGVTVSNNMSFRGIGIGTGLIGYFGL
jgi:hypothetical protein